MMKNKLTIDRTALSVGSLAEIDFERREYWSERTGIERWEALEWMRVQMHGYDPAAERIQRVFEMSERQPG